MPGRRIDRRPVTDAISVGDYLVCFGRNIGDPLTNLKLQKLLYYSQGEFIGQHNKALFSHTLQAWIRGPVVYEVWSRFRHHRWEPIAAPKLKEPVLPAAVSTHLAEVIDRYWNYSAYTLESMTHRETPWLNARQGIAKDTPSSAPISLGDMQTYFSQSLNERKKTISKIPARRQMA